jgi:hypothetical protein
VYGLVQFMTGCQILEPELERPARCAAQALFVRYPWLKQYNAWANQARHVEQMVAAMAQLRGNGDRRPSDAASRRLVAARPRIADGRWPR